MRTGLLLAVIGVWVLLNTVHSHSGGTLVDRILEPSKFKRATTG